MVRRIGRSLPSRWRCSAAGPGATAAPGPSYRRSAEEKANGGGYAAGVGVVPAAGAPRYTTQSGLAHQGADSSRVRSASAQVGGGGGGEATATRAVMASVCTPSASATMRLTRHAGSDAAHTAAWDSERNRAAAPGARCALGVGAAGDPFETADCIADHAGEGCLRRKQEVGPRGGRRGKR